jgi:hypothetical protein
MLSRFASIRSGYKQATPTRQTTITTFTPMRSTFSRIYPAITNYFRSFSTSYKTYSPTALFSKLQRLINPTEYAKNQEDLFNLRGLV